MNGYIITWIVESEESEIKFNGQLPSLYHMLSDLHFCVWID